MSTLRVTAVIVSHNGARWLPALLGALNASTRAPDCLVAVDTASTDSSPELLQNHRDIDVVVMAPPSTGFGAAVALGLEQVDRSRVASPFRSHMALPHHSQVASPGGSSDDWVWLLHDDCAPAPTALAELIGAVEADPDIELTGPKIRAWPRAHRLLEAGVSISGSGRRMTGIDAGEYDQGQHDEPRDVLAVSSAGAFIRRDLWDRLGGLDPYLPMFRDDVDLGWRAARIGARVRTTPAATIFHAEAASRGVRQITAGARNPHCADREAALITLLANSSALALPLRWVRLLVGSLLRALGFLVGKLPGVAWDELVAAGAALFRPARLFRVRRSRRALPQARSRVKQLRPSWWAPYRDTADAVLVRIVEGWQSLRVKGPDARAEAGRAVARRTTRATGIRAWAGRHLVVTMTALLVVLSLVATRGLWGSGFLQGGALLPAPNRASDWWYLYRADHHAVGGGSDRPASPYVAVLAGLGRVAFGDAGLIVDVVMLLAVPLSAMSAYAAARHLVGSVAARVFMAVTYGLLPAVTGAASAGRLGTVVTTILLPWLLLAAAPLIRPGAARWRSVAATALMLSVMTSFAPVGWPLAAIAGLGMVGYLLAHGRPRAAVQVIVTVALPALTLLPWSWNLLAHPHAFVAEAGAFDVGQQLSSPPGWHWLLGRVDAPGNAPLWIGIGTVLAALAALLRSDRRGPVLACWATVAGGLIAVLLLAQITVSSPDDSTVVPWLGVPVVVVAAALIVAAGLAADGLVEAVTAESFGWRQLLAPVTVIVALSTPVLGTLWWGLTAPHGALHRAPALDLPAYVQDVIADDASALVLASSAKGVRYDLVTGDGARLGDDSVLSDSARQVSPLVADLLTGQRRDAADRLAERQIRYVAVRRPVPPAVVAQLDKVPGLVRTGSDVHGLLIWQLSRSVKSGEGSEFSTSRDHRLIAQEVVLAVLVVMMGPGLRRREGPGAL
jgi:GT2 family glycosyltransferase